MDERLHKYITPNPFIFHPFHAGPRICLGQEVREWPLASALVPRKREILTQMLACISRSHILPHPLYADFQRLFVGYEGKHTPSRVVEDMPWSTSDRKVIPSHQGDNVHRGKQHPERLTALSSSLLGRYVGQDEGVQ